MIIKECCSGKTTLINAYLSYLLEFNNETKILPTKQKENTFYFTYISSSHNSALYLEKFY